jgi:hypothetical protein
MIQRYVSKISGPLLDRIDIHVEIPAVKYKELRSPSSSEDSASVRGRVIAARELQTERYRSHKATYANAQMMPNMIRKFCAISSDGEKLLENAITKLGLSARAHDRILKVARTIADLDGMEHIEPAAPERSHPVPCSRPLLLGLADDSRRFSSLCNLGFEAYWDSERWSGGHGNGFPTRKSQNGPGLLFHPLH